MNTVVSQNPGIKVDTRLYAKYTLKLQSFVADDDKSISILDSFYSIDKTGYGYKITIQMENTVVYYCFYCKSLPQDNVRLTISSHPRVRWFNWAIKFVSEIASLLSDDTSNNYTFFDSDANFEIDKNSAYYLNYLDKTVMKYVDDILR